jgi:hypothetical protein
MGLDFSFHIVFPSFQAKSTFLFVKKNSIFVLLEQINENKRFIDYV